MEGQVDPVMLPKLQGLVRRWLARKRYKRLCTYTSSIFRTLLHLLLLFLMLLFIYLFEVILFVFSLITGLVCSFEPLLSLLAF